MSVVLTHTDTGGDGSPLIIIHGLFGSRDNWRSHQRYWQSSHRVIAVDLRNHGASPHVAGMSYAAMAEDVLVVMNSLGIESAHLLGHSMGGKVAISLARLFPERVRSLIVADIAPVAYDHHGHEDVFAALNRVAKANPAGRSEADALMAEDVSERAVRLFLATNLVRSEEGGLCLRIGLKEIEAGYSDIIGLPAGEGAFDGPALVVRGGRSPYVSDENLSAVYDVLPQARLVTLDGAGHWLHAEQPDAFQRSIDDFLAR
ncbi:alpha/beta fold hydrolase [Halomonas halocynthiae]|uniref:alpha/beta fold hydrolase n=1 Tax=Halomonas halocynthiae TaxID=176290 RepID=UPI00041DB97A|nr:alpha/beta fold hydrolase [Halomonas halocynthiae]